MQNYIRDGRCIDYTPTQDVQGGDLIVFPAMVAVASTDIAVGQLGACEAEGVYELLKDASSFAQGAVVYAKADGTVTSTATGNVRAGVAWSGAAGSEETVEVNINA